MIVETSHHRRAFPTLDDPEPEGYIWTEPIDGYENRCLHVKVKSSVAHTENGDFVLGARYNLPYKDIDERDPWQVAPGMCWKVSSTGRPPLSCSYQTADDRYFVYRGYTLPPSGLTHSQLSDFADSDDGWLVGSNRIKLGSRPGTSSVTRQKAWEVFSCLKDANPYSEELEGLFYECCDSLRFNSNNIANAQSAMDLLASARSGASLLNALGEQISKSAADIAKDLWLKYRYVYNTTKSDLEEAARFINKMGSGNSGTIRAQSSVGNCKLTLKLRYRPYENNFIQMASELVSLPQKLGFDLSLYNAWDMIPFSFVADWFLPIGDNLERMAQIKWSASMPYRIDALYSIKGDVKVGRETFSVYYRDSFTPTYTFDRQSKDGSSRHTWIKRGVDVISLI